MSPLVPSFGTTWYRFPRVSGDEPVLPLGKLEKLVFSPRERG